MVRSFLRKLFPAAVKPTRQATRARLALEALEGRALPSVTPVYVDDSWASVAAGQDPDGSGPATAIGQDAFASIQAGVDAAADGGTVLVAAGTYNESVVIDKTLTLEGANAGISAGLAAGTRNPESVLNGGIAVEADGVTIDGFKIVGGTSVFNAEPVGVYLAAGASGTTIQNNILTGNESGRGILSTFNGDNDDLTIQNNDIGFWTTGVFNQSNDGVSIVGNRIHDNVAGVGNDFVNDLSIQKNTFTGNDEAVGVFESTDVQVNFNTIPVVGAGANDSGVINYTDEGGPAVDASFNYWGTTDPAVIADNVTGDVTVSSPLAAPVTARTSVWTGGGATLVVDAATGRYTFTLSNGTTYTGTGARVRNGKLQIHDQSSNGKIDVTGSLDGSVTVHLRGKNARAFTLDASAS